MNPYQFPSAIVLTGNRGSGSDWWRATMPVSYLQRLGLNVVFAQNMDPTAPMEIGAYDLIILSRLVFPSIQTIRKYVKKVHQAGKTVIFDVDDDLFTYAGYALEAVEGEKAQLAVEDLPKARATAQTCDGVTTTNAHLAARVGAITKKPTAIIPNLLDVVWWRKVQELGGRQIPADTLSIGWVGGRRNAADLDILVPVWAAVADLRPEVHFCVAGYHGHEALQEAVPEGRLTLIPWTGIESYPLSYNSIDIGCCPLAPHAFNFSKSLIKAVEFGASRAPVVASPTIYSRMKSLAIARNTDEWVEKLLVLVDDAELRKQAARALYNEVVAEHSLQTNWLKIPAGWQHIVDQSQARRVLTPESEVITL